MRRLLEDMVLVTAAAIGVAVVAVASLAVLPATATVEAVRWVRERLAARRALRQALRHARWLEVLE